MSYNELFPYISQGINEGLRQAKREANRQRRKGIFKTSKPKEKYPNTGRNDLCPCGSGKKYKKCCLNAEGKLNGE